LYHVDVDSVDVADILEIYATPILRVEVNRMVSVGLVHLTHRKQKRAGSLSMPVGIMEKEMLSK
jgi:hypothetical protein